MPRVRACIFLCFLLGCLSLTLHMRRRVHAPTRLSLIFALSPFALFAGPTQKQAKKYIVRSRDTH